MPPNAALIRRNESAGDCTFTIPLVVDRNVEHSAHSEGFARDGDGPFWQRITLHRSVPSEWRRRMHPPRASP
jgi:hypothetical protein